MATLRLGVEDWTHSKRRASEDLRRSEDVEGANRDLLRGKAARNFEKAADGVPLANERAGNDILENLINAIKCAQSEKHRAQLLVKMDLAVMQIELGEIPFYDLNKNEVKLVREAESLMSGKQPNIEDVEKLRFRTPVRPMVQIDETRCRTDLQVRRALDEMDAPDPFDTDLPMYPRS